MTLARSLGVLGTLASLALAIWAFSGAPSETKKLRRPWGPTLGPDAAAAAIRRGGAPNPLPSVAPVMVVPEPATEEAASHPSGPTDGSNEEHEASNAEREAAHATPRAARVPGAAHQPRAGAAPVLTQEEIRRRKEQYERWLREQGLQRIDEVLVPPPPEAPANQSGE